MSKSITHLQSDIRGTLVISLKLEQQAPECPCRCGVDQFFIASQLERDPRESEA